ncbi:hypothetical protein UT300018_04500 [Clostridium faecium]
MKSKALLINSPFRLKNLTNKLIKKIKNKCNNMVIHLNHVEYYNKILYTMVKKVFLIYNIYFSKNIY